MENNNGYYEAYYEAYYKHLSCHLSASTHLIITRHQLMSVCGSTDGSVDVLHRVWKKTKSRGCKPLKAAKF